MFLGCRPGLSNGEDEKQLQESGNGDPTAAFSSRSGTGECVLSNLKPENMWSIKSEWFLLLQTVATPQ
ncbi:hypothetical protein D8674_030545 [Pyrus ussuriensis x Pyrus communis]|uniref:Uncharacterized protein n=1 Tax=Pyrus ussuriensis x Pyrus communis TaxID=2448454 RepID=A0A5N5EWF0_9ROSA|nr:hypothetical protein D8674_030545 [Pyrus ussuriensis x Pyrus communis]